MSPNPTSHVFLLVEDGRGNTKLLAKSFWNVDKNTVLEDWIQIATPPLFAV